MPRPVSVTCRRSRPASGTEVSTVSVPPAFHRVAGVLDQLHEAPPAAGRRCPASAGWGWRIRRRTVMPRVAKGLRAAQLQRVVERSRARSIGVASPRRPAAAPAAASWPRCSRMRSACSSTSLTSGRGGMVAGQIGQQQLRQPQDPGQRVVDLVRHAGAQRADAPPANASAAADPGSRAARCSSASTRFSRVSFQAVISSVWRRISMRAASSDVVMALKRLGQLAQLVVGLRPSSLVSRLPGRSAAPPAPAPPPGADRLRARAAADQRRHAARDPDPEEGRQRQPPHRRQRLVDGPLDHHPEAQISGTPA